MIRGFAIATVVLAATAIAVTAQQARDARIGPEPSGTALVTGVVVSDENPDRPISRAIVTLSGSGLILGRTAITGSDGRFSFGNLPEGDFTVRATKGGYIPAPYGARRPGRPGTPLTVSAGQTSDIRIRMPRGAVIAGTVRTATGAPAPGLGVEIVPVPRVATNLRVNVVSQSVVTDDRGAYRVYGLLPGDYLVAAIPSRPGSFASASLPGMEMRSMGSNNLTTRSSAEIDAIFRDLQTGSAGQRGPIVTTPGGPARLTESPPAQATYGFAPVYYPGTVIVGQASKVTVRQAEEREGIDIAVDLVRTTTVQGVVTNPHGAVPGIGLSIQPADPRPNGAPIAAPVLSKSPGPDGLFEYTGLTPGRYVIWARSREAVPTGPSMAGGRGGASAPGAGGSAAQLWAMAEITASGEPISGVTLVLQPTLAIAGQVRFEASSLERPENLANVRVSLVSETAPFGGMSNLTNFGGIPIPAAQVQTDGTFQLTGIVPGTYRLSATLPGAPGWWLRSALLGDRDLLDFPLEVGAAADTRTVVVTFSDRPGEIAGSLRAPEGTPAPDYFVLVFPADPALWRPGSRRVHTTRPATNGQFSIRGLPRGDYLLGALTDMDPADVHDPAFLEQVAASAIKLSLKDGEQKRQDIQILPIRR
jgi:hypothetical protein